MKIGLSLGSGGARGWAHLGVLQVFEENGIPIDLVNGASIGAVVGGAYALYKDTKKMFLLAKQAIDTIDVNYFNIFRHSTSSTSFINNFLLNAICDIAALKISLLSHKNSIKALELFFGDRKFRDTKISFSAVTTDLVSRRLISIKEGGLVDGILPAISIPGIFPPVKRDGSLLVDGGVLANVPVREIRKQGAEFVIAVRLVDKTKPKFCNGFELISYLDSLKFSEFNKRELDVADFLLDIDTSGLDSGKFDGYEKALSIGQLQAKRQIPRLIEAINHVK